MPRLLAVGHVTLDRLKDQEVVGATAQGWLREIDFDGSVSPREWRNPSAELLGVHALIYSEQDLERPEERAQTFLQHVPVVVVTRGYRGLQVVTRGAVLDVPA